MAKQLPETSSPSPGRTEPASRLRLVVLGLIALYVLLFIVLNRQRVEVSFVFFSVHASVLFAVLVSVALGFAAGYLFHRSRSGPRVAPKQLPPADAGPRDSA